MSEETVQQPSLPTPDPALKWLNRFVGTWSMEGHLVGSTENNIKGEATYRWLPGGFFLEQRITLDFMAMQIDSLELIGYDPESKPFPRQSSRTCRQRPCRTRGRSATTQSRSRCHTVC